MGTVLKLRKNQIILFEIEESEVDHVPWDVRAKGESVVLTVLVANGPLPPRIIEDPLASCPRTTSDGKGLRPGGDTGRAQHEPGSQQEGGWAGGHGWPVKAREPTGHALCSGTERGWNGKTGGWGGKRVLRARGR